MPSVGGRRCWAQLNRESVRRLEGARMALIHDLSAHAAGGVSGLQTAQRDWSPLLVHFTSYSAMAPVRAAVGNQSTPSQVLQALNQADQQSFAVVQQIAHSGNLRAHSPAQKNGVAACVSLSECTLPGLIALSERYGRFGFVFRKSDVFGFGGRPCLYVDRTCYGHIANQAQHAPAGSPAATIFGLANVYSPPGFGQIQDFTHEREWRIFSNLDLANTPPSFLICPSAYIAQVSALFGAQIPCISIDTMHEWGA